VVDQACRRLRLPTIRAVLEEVLTVAGREQLSYQGFLAECDYRDRRSSSRRVKSAGFPRDKWLGDFDFDANPNISQATIHTLATGDWIRKGQPLCLIGDSGTGKSHRLIGLGTAAAEKGFRVMYTLASRLVNELVEAENDKALAKTFARYGRVDLLCIIDELGYMELDKRGAELLFQVLTEREEKASVATNPSPAGRKPSPTRASARPSWTGSPSTEPSSKPGPTPTASPAHWPNKRPAKPPPGSSMCARAGWHAGGSR
jgi:DNA replication protein DnaC